MKQYYKRYYRGYEILQIGLAWYAINNGVTVACHRYQSALYLILNGLPVGSHQLVKGL